MWPWKWPWRKIWWPWKVPKWPWFLVEVAVKACRDLATLYGISPVTMRYPRQAHMWVGLWNRWSAHFSTCQTLYLSSPLLGKAKPTFNLCHFPPIFFINPFQNLNILSVFLTPTTFHKQTACTHQPFYTSTIFQLNHILEINCLTLKKVYTSTSLQFNHFYT